MRGGRVSQVPEYRVPILQWGQEPKRAALSGAG